METPAKDVESGKPPSRAELEALVAADIERGTPPSQAELEALVAEIRSRRAPSRRRDRPAADRSRDRVVAVPAVVRLALAVHVRRRCVQRYRGARHPPVVRAAARLHGLSGAEILATRSRPPHRLGAGGRCGLRRDVSHRLLSGAVPASRAADALGRCRGRGRRGAAARSVPPGGRPVDAGHFDRVPVLRFRRPLPAGTAGAQGRLGRTRGLALLAHVGRRVRRRARRFDRVHLPVRAVRRAAGEGGCRKLFHPACVLAARAVPRRTRQGRRRVLRHDRHDLRLLGRQRGDHRHLHHPADEARRLLAGAGGRDRVRGRRERPADAAGDGRRGVPDGRICRHHLRGRGASRVPAGDHHLRGAVLHRRHRGGEEGHDGPAAHAPAHACAGRPVGPADVLRPGHPGRTDLLGPRLDQAGVRRDRKPGRARAGRRRLRGAGRESRPASGPAARRSDQGPGARAGLLRGRAHRAALPAAGDGADLVPVGRGNVPRAGGILGRDRDGRRGAHPASADGFLPRPAPAWRATGGRGCAISSAAWRTARAT